MNTLQERIPKKAVPIVPRVPRKTVNLQEASVGEQKVKVSLYLYYSIQ